MVLNREVELSRQRQNRQHEPRRQRVLCKIVRVAGNIKVPNKPGFIWVQDRDPDAATPPFHAFNDKVQRAVGLEVWVELTPNGWEVAEVATGLLRLLPNYTGNPYLPNHHESHEWPDFAPQADAINVYPRALTMLRCYPGEAGGLTVSVAPLRYRKNGALVLFAGAHNVDLSGSQPAAGQAIYVGVYLDTSTNAIATAAGAAVIDSPVVYPPTPTFPGTDCIPTAMVRLDGSQTVFTEADFLDSRFWLDDASASSDAQFLTLAADAGLANERVFTPIAPLAGVDNGAGLTYDLSVGAASESASGVAELATQTETNTGTDDLRIVTPLKLATRLAAALAALKPYQLWESDGGNVVVEVDAAGNIVINDSPADRDIRIESAINPNAFFFQGSNGALGLGTNAPVGVLHTVGDSVNLQPTWNSYGYGSTPTVIGIRTNGTEASPTAVTDGNNIWLWTGYGYDGSVARLAAEIRFEVDSPSGGNIPADIVFRTHDSGLSAGSTSEKMRLLSGGDLQISSGGDLLLTGPAAPQSQTQNGVIDTIGHLLDGGHPLNPYPSSRNNDDAEFNNSTQADNNTIGTIAGGHYWEWLANNPAAGSGAYDINSTKRSHLWVRVNRTDGDASLQADLAASVPAATLVNFTACLRFVYPFSTTTDEYFAIRLLDVSTTNYYEVSFRNTGAGGMGIRSDRVDGGARTQDGSTLSLTEVPATIWLNWQQQSNTKYRATFSYDGLVFINAQANAYTFTNTFIADRIILIFGQSDSAALTAISYYVDSIRRT